MPDGTLAQHCGHDGYKRWIESSSEEDPVQAVNTRVRDLLLDEGEAEIWDVLSAKNVFDAQSMRLERWLEATNCRRVVFGHTPHRSRTPESHHDGRAINFDGGLSRGHRNHQRSSPPTASVAPLEVLS